MKDKSTTITIKLSPEERNLIRKKAAECGLTVSAYGRALMLGFEPKARLTEHQMRLLENLDGCRSDMINFGNFVRGMIKHSVGNSNRLFANFPVILQWYNEVQAVTDRVENFLSEARRPSPTRLTDIKDKQQ